MRELGSLLLLSNLLLIIFAYSSAAFELKVSPPSLNFTGESGELICQNLKLYGGGQVVFDNVWSYKDSGQISDYNLRKEDLGIEVDDIDSFFLDGQKDVFLCLRGKSSGEYYGLFLMSVNNAGVGVRLRVNVVDGSRNLISEFSVENIAGAKLTNAGLVSFILLAFLLLMLVRKLHNSN